jgi:outer membrane lipoprotein LolB
MRLTKKVEQKKCPGELSLGLQNPERLFLGFGLLLLCACVSVPSTSRAPVDFYVKPAEESFTLEGRLAVKHAGDGYSASFSWVQTGPNYSIMLWGPLGQGRTVIEGNASFIEITTADGVKHSDDQPERLMQRWLGWSIPLQIFKFWVQGRPGPLSEADLPEDVAGGITRDEAGGFEQLNWRISPSRHRVIDDTWMPMKTVAAREEFKITLIIRKAGFGKSKGSLDSRVSPHQNSRLSRSGDLYVVDLQANPAREFTRYRTQEESIF